MEFGDFAMMRRMLLGIRERAEALVGAVNPQPLPTKGSTRTFKTRFPRRHDRVSPIRCPGGFRLCDQVRREGIGPL
jgi:hypothetical protein